MLPGIGPRMLMAAGKRAPVIANFVQSSDLGAGAVPATVANMSDGLASTYAATATGRGSIIALLADLASVSQVTLMVPGGWVSNINSATLQGSADGSTYTTLVTLTSAMFAAGVAQSFAVSGTFIRLRVLDNANISIALAEFTVA